jgi:Ca2+-binding EF-hand superfamily protein
LHAKTFFADYDKLHRGQCTVGQFRRGLKTGFGLPEEDIEALVAKYSLSEGVEVYYAQLHNDLEALTGNATEETSTSSSSSFPLHAAAVGERGLKSPSHAAHVVDPEERLRAYASLHRIRFSEFLRDYDKLRLGKVPYATFVAALGAIKLPRDRLSAEELTLLADRYAEDDVLDASKPHMTRRIVKWKAFCASVEGSSSSSSSSSSSEETATVGQCLSPTTRRALTISLGDASSPQNGSHAQDADGELGRVIHLVKERVRTRRILLKPVFVDFDRAGAGVYTTGRVSKERFRRAMATMGFVLTEAQYKALEQQYASPDGSEVMYALFVDDVDNVKEMVGQSAF